MDDLPYLYAQGMFEPKYRAFLETIFSLRPTSVTPS